MLVLVHGRLDMKMSREQETFHIGSAWALDPALRRGSQLRWEEPPFKFSGKFSHPTARGARRKPGSRWRYQRAAKVSGWKWLLLDHLAGKRHLNALASPASRGRAFGKGEENSGTSVKPLIRHRACHRGVLPSDLRRIARDIDMVLLTMN